MRPEMKRRKVDKFAAEKRTYQNKHTNALKSFCRLRFKVIFQVLFIFKLYFSSRQKNRPVDHRWSPGHPRF